MKVLVACEESQAVCKAFREKGHDAFSCDIMPCSGGHPEWHIKDDVLKILNPRIIQYGLSIDDTYFGFYFRTQDGMLWTIMGGWDLIIAHPPCTYLTVTGNRWFDVSRYGDKALKRIEERKKAIQFFMNFTPRGGCSAPKICIENPVGIMSTEYKKPNQIIQPYMFGDPYEKKTCLWLFGLKPLEPTNIVKPEPRTYFSSGKSMPTWYANAFGLSAGERSKLRSKTFPGIANTMAEQWG